MLITGSDGLRIVEKKTGQQSRDTVTVPFKSRVLKLISFALQP